MVDTARSRADILTLFADNVTGAISAQDARDMIVSTVPTEKQFAGDYWTEPLPAMTTYTDRTGRGFIEYSHCAGVDLSFGNVVYFDSTSLLRKAYASGSGQMPMIGVVLESYLSNASNVQVLRRGILVMTYYSGTFSGNVGRPVYLCYSAGSAGHFSVTYSCIGNVSVPPIVGVVCASTVTFAGYGKMFVNPAWWVTGT